MTLQLCREYTCVHFVCRTTKFSKEEIRTMYRGFKQVGGIDISQFRQLLGFFLLYKDRVPFDLLDSAALV
jgi:hypothetical protein